ncbi:MAG TPA: orotidine-5'-phosphate decarboxylase [Bacteroidales bacterium]|nr:orotidine-5'-phosphate decarboxylase [Bacteroidales bacterium]
MDRKELFGNILKKRSFLCIGLDSDIYRIPSFLKDTDDPVFEFNRGIIDATHKLAVAYKPNIAFYESLGSPGWLALNKTVDYLKANYPDIFLIADAKRGDIGNTSKLYARAFFENMNFDAVTVAPYMGEDSVSPFLDYPGKWVILLALTSNRGADDFQYHPDDKNSLYRLVLNKSQSWADRERMMYVVGATRAEMLSEIREIVPDHFLLIPGVGAQGGSLDKVAEHGFNSSCGLLVNSSRGIIFADNSENYASVAAVKARELQQQMESHLYKKGLL